MPPRWALGFLQSTRHFENPDEWRQLPVTIRDKRLPCDGLIFLSTYGDFFGWNRGVGHLECEPRSLPDPAGFFAHLRAQHFHVITHEYPVLHPASPLYPEASTRGYLLDAGYPEATPAERPTDNYREGHAISISPTRRPAGGGGGSIARSSTSASMGGGWTAEKDLRPTPSCAPAPARPSTTATI